LRDYEVLYIAAPDLDEEKVQDVVKKVNSLIEKAGGSIERTNLWGKRKLAYEVRSQKDGYYVLQDFKFAPERIPELDAALKITEEVFRHLIARRHESKVASAVAPPKAEAVPEPIAEPAEAVPAATADGEEDS